MRTACRLTFAAAALASLTACDPTPSRSAVDEVVTVREAASIAACHDIVLRAMADACVVASGPEAGARVEPAGIGAHGRVTAAITVRQPT